MDAREILLDALGRSREVSHMVLDGLTPEAANARPVVGSASNNSITWLVWHLARQADAQAASLAGVEQVWTREGWSGRLGLPVPAQSIGFGQSDAEASSIVVHDLGLLTGYLDAVCAFIADYVTGLSDADLDQVIDTSWTPPVTRGVRLVSIVDDAAQHAGQAAYARGLVANWRAAY